jgi:hypothetical protein
MMKKHVLCWLSLLIVFCASCGGKEVPANELPFCPRPAGTPHHLTVPPELLPTPQPFSSAGPVEIRGKTVFVDRVVEGPLCNDTWSGTVYVTCNVQVYPWEGQPTFLENCDLTVEPGTVVYVADHGDEPYYKGCSCHNAPGEP